MSKADVKSEMRFEATVPALTKTIMVALEETIIIPLVVTEQGTIRIKGSRVSLDSIVHHFKLGATANCSELSFSQLRRGLLKYLLTTLHIARKLKCIWNSKK